MDQTQPHPIRYASDFVRVWGNIVTINTNLYDLTILFGQHIADAVPDPCIEHQVAVSMSWQGAQALVGLLTSLIRAHEQQTGESLLPPHASVSSLPAEA